MSHLTKRSTAHKEKRKINKYTKHKYYLSALQSLLFSFNFSRNIILNILSFAPSFIIHLQHITLILFIISIHIHVLLPLWAPPSSSLPPSPISRLTGFSTQRKCFSFISFSYRGGGYSSMHSGQRVAEFTFKSIPLKKVSLERRRSEASPSFVRADAAPLSRAQNGGNFWRNAERNGSSERRGGHKRLFEG